MEIAREYLTVMGPKNALSHAIEDGQDVPVLRALVALGAEVWCTSWNMACFNGDFKAIEFLESVDAWSAINEQAISYAIRGGNLKVAKWLRAHDPPAPWDHWTTNAVIAAFAKAAGMPVSTVPLEERPDGTAPDLDDWRDYKVGERIEYMGQQPKDLPVPVLEEMAKWLKSEGAPCAAEMAEELQKMCAEKMNWQFDPEGYEELLKHLRVTPPAETVLRKHGIDPRTLKKSQPPALSFEEALSLFTGRMKAIEEMQLAMGYGDTKKMVSIMWETGVFPDNINGVPFDILWVSAKVMQAKLSDDSEPYKPSEKEIERAGEFQKELGKGAEQQFGKTVGRKAHKYLVERGVEHAMSCAIEDDQDLSVLRALIGLGAKVWHESWNVACYMGNFKIMEFLDSEGYWSEINEQAIAYAIKGGQLEVAKWLRAHDPPAPWDDFVTICIIEAAAKARGYALRVDDREFKPGENIEKMGKSPKDMPMDLIEEMTDWLMSVGAPGAANMAMEMRKGKAAAVMQDAWKAGNFQTFLRTMLESGAYPDRMEGMPLDEFLRKKVNLPEPLVQQVMVEKASKREGKPTFTQAKIKDLLVKIKKDYAKERSEVAFKTLSAYCRNLLKVPLEAKFRSINSQSNAFKQRVASLEGGEGVSILGLVGFKLDSSKMYVIREFSLNKLLVEAALAELTDAINNPSFGAV